MGLFNKMKKFFSGFKYKLDREILREYLQHTINFAVENKLPFCDEFYIADSLDAKDRLHVAILNYDVPGEAVYEIEKIYKPRTLHVARRVFCIHGYGADYA